MATSALGCNLDVDGISWWHGLGATFRPLAEVKPELFDLELASNAVA